MALDYLRRYVKTNTDAALAIEPRLDESGQYPLESLLAGRLMHGTDGACFVTDTTRQVDEQYGTHRFGAWSSVTAANLSLIAHDTELAYADLTGAVFLDTETTGLSMGAGTHVFLVGAGYFEGSEFHVRQFFLRGPDEESSLLEALDAFLRRFSLLITFNGKAFDWPLLESRFLGNRQFRRAPLDDPLHLDLLHPARRFWKRRLDNCRLSSLERQILGLERTEEDVPGWMIPSMYFAYLRSGDGRNLRRVFYHNLHDILSLAGLTLHMNAMIANPAGGLVSHAVDFLCLARAYERAGAVEEALLCLEEALHRQPETEIRCESLLQLAALYKHERRWDTAWIIWERLLDEGGECSLYALIERAKYQEHVEHAYLEALDDVQQALTLLELQPARRDDEQRAELEHRRGRLISRAYRHRSWSDRRR